MSSYQLYLQHLIQLGVSKDIKSKPNLFKSCQICCNFFTEQSPPSLLTCGHFICIECLKYETQSEKCSICPQKIFVKEKIFQEYFKTSQIFQEKEKEIIGGQFKQDRMRFTYEQTEFNEKDLNKELFAQTKRLPEMFAQLKNSGKAMLIIQGENLKYEQIKDKKIWQIFEEAPESIIFVNMNQKQIIHCDKFVDFAFKDLKSSIVKTSLRNPAKYRVIDEGLNLEGRCTNSLCEAFQNRCWIQKGFGVFSLNQESENSSCPLCKIIVTDVFKLGVWRATAQVEGVIKDKHQKKKIEKYLKSQGDDHLQIFEEFNCTEGQWVYLKITVEQLKK